MKFKSEKSELVNCLKDALKGAKGSMGGYIRIDVTENGVRMLATSAEMAVATKVATDGLGLDNETGTVIVDAKMLDSIVGKMPNDTIELVSDDKLLTLKCKKVKSQLGLVETEKFLMKNLNGSPEGSVTVKISGETFRQMVEKTAFAVGEDSDKNRIMSGLYINVRKGILTACALDGHRMAIRKEKIEDKEAEAEVIVPGNLIRDVAPSINDETCMLRFSKNQFQILTSGTLFSMSIVDGKYFDIDAMINKSAMTETFEVSLPKEDLIGAIDRAILMQRGDAKKPLVFEFSDEGDVMEVSIKSSVGSMEEELSVGISGTKSLSKIGFNPKLIKDFVKIQDGEKVKMNLSSPKMPGTIVDPDGKYFYMLLPVNIAGAAN